MDNQGYEQGLYADNVTSQVTQTEMQYPETGSAVSESAVPSAAPQMYDDVPLTGDIGTSSQGMMMPMQYVAPLAAYDILDPAYPVTKPMGWRAPPALVFFALLICFPVGLVLLLFFTRWGAFAKIFISLFVIICVWALYEVLCLYSVLDLPSLLQMIIDLFK